MELDTSQQRTRSHPGPQSAKRRRAPRDGEARIILVIRLLFGLGFCLIRVLLRLLQIVLNVRIR